MSVAEAIRFDMLKKPATADVPDVAVGEASVAQRLPVLLLDRGGGLRHQHGEIEDGPLAWSERRDAVVHHQHLTELRLAGELADGRAMGGEAIEAAVLGRHDHGDHLALQLREAGRREH